MRAQTNVGDTLATNYAEYSRYSPSIARLAEPPVRNDARLFPDQNGTSNPAKCHLQPLFDSKSHNDMPQKFSGNSARFADQNEHHEVEIILRIRIIKKVKKWNC